MLSGASLLDAQTMHFFDSPSDLVRQIRRIKTLKANYPVQGELVIWEPAPSYCTPGHLDSVFEAVKLVDFFSPNHIELMGLFGQAQRTKLEKHRLEAVALQFMEKGIGHRKGGSIIVRGGEHGCMICRPRKMPIWIPPFYDAGTYGADRDTVVDTTGAGNAFLGAFAVGFHKELDIIKAAQWGTVAASFALEQTGLPKLTTDSNGRELWNGTCFADRLQAYQDLHGERQSSCMDSGRMTFEL